MAERSETVEQEAVRDVSAAYSVEAGTASAEDLPPGYKRTEVGIIPSEWGVAPILDLVQLPRGQVNPQVEPYRSMTLVAPDHIQEGTGVLLASVSAAAQGAISGKYLFEPGDVVYSKIRPYLQKVFLAPFRGLCSADMYPLRSRPDVSSGFVLNTLLSEHFTEFAVSVSARSGIPKINRAELAQYRVATPPPEEQHAIATALSDADALIESLDRLIAKKRAIKQAAMQQLLTGQTRLPGFTGEWETKRLGDVASFHKGSGLSKADLVTDGANPCIHYGELFTQYGEAITHVYSRTNQQSGCFKSLQNDVLMPTSDVTPNGLATASCITHSDVILGGDVLVIRCPESEMDGTFIAYKIRIDYQQIMQLVSGTTVFHIYGRDMANFVYKAPEIEEQRAIVSVLADMDTDIKALQHRRDKARQIKQGMMQQLLTGRVRLVEPEVAA